MPKPDSRPCARVEGRDLGDEYLFYDAARDRVHVLNESARAVFLLCDGTRTAADVARAFAEDQPVHAETARRDAETLLDDLASLGLIDLEEVEAPARDS